MQWLRLLPLHLRRPQAVLLDRRHNTAALLMLFDGEGGAKLVVRLDYRLKKQKGTLANLIRTGALLDASELSALRGEIGRGLTLLEGDL